MRIIRFYWKNKAEDRFDSIQRSIDTLNENFVLDKDFKNFVIYKGQKFKADAAYIDIYQQAKKSIYVVDDYVNTKNFTAFITETLRHKCDIRNKHDSAGYR